MKGLVEIGPPAFAHAELVQVRVTGIVVMGNADRHFHAVHLCIAVGEDQVSVMEADIPGTGTAGRLGVIAEVFLEAGEAAVAEREVRLPGRGSGFCGIQADNGRGGTVRNQGNPVILSGIPFFREGGNIQRCPGIASLGNDPAVLVNGSEGWLVRVSNGGWLPVAEGFLCKEEHTVRGCRRHNRLETHGSPGDEMIRTDGREGCDLYI